MKVLLEKKIKVESGAGINPGIYEVKSLYLSHVSDEFLSMGISFDLELIPEGKKTTLSYSASSSFFKDSYFIGEPAQS